MKITSLLLILLAGFISQPVFSSRPENGFIFAYGTEKNGGRNGLHFAWSNDRENWHPIGPEHRFVGSDYGRWGAEKRMVTPYLYEAPDGLWHCVWSLNEYDGTFAHAASEDLIIWKRQSYPVVMPANNCLLPEISYDKTGKEFIITWLSDSGSNTGYFSARSSNLKDFHPAAGINGAERLNDRMEVVINGVSETGTIHTVPWKTIDNLIKTQQLSAYKNNLWSERMSDDPARFRNLEGVEATIKIDGSDPKVISDMLMGVFFEDINYAADGGLYAELVQNRGFEYAPGDRDGRDESWNSYKAWSITGGDADFTIDTVSPIHPNNKHYAVLDIKKSGTGLVNEGFNGIPITAGQNYTFSVFARSLDNSSGILRVLLTGLDGEIYGEARTSSIAGEWQKHHAELTANKTVASAMLKVVPEMTGKVAMDMISLFPGNTFMGRENGLRADLAQSIADLNPRFFRFPGGCVAHGDGLGNMYRWKNTIGPLEERVPQRNIWGYHQTAGLGYFEYFQFCEDLGAEPIPIVAAGVPCQNSHTGGPGQQGGIPMCEMDDYVQEILDLIEWANGDVNTQWGRHRAAAGHPEPFNLKYIGIGNEDLITDIFEERFTLIYNTVKEKHPEITLIGTVGPFFEGTDYVEGWNLAGRLDIPIVDEHYYAPPGWFIHNQDFYDKYDRSKSKVYLGEYAAHLPGRPNNIETALTEALHLTTLERNGDIVMMASYAPLFAKDGFTQWNPDLIYFTNTEVKPTVGYYVQQLFGQNSGDIYLPGRITLSDSREAVRKRVAISAVKDSKTGDLILKLVNLLPVAVIASVDLQEMDVPAGGATVTVLQGEPGERNATPETSVKEVSGEFPCSFPAYSLTVIRIQGVD